MKQGKISKVLVCFFLVLLPVILLPASTALVVNIWGPADGATKTYTYKQSYNGTINSEIDYGDVTFVIENIWDADGNNYTELIYSRQRMSGGSPDIDLFGLNDAAADWTDADLTVVLSAGEIHPLVPVGYNGTDGVGMNWTARLNSIEAITNYTIIFEQDSVLIYHWTLGSDVLTGAQTSISEYIRWDNTTGWLISYNLITHYGNPANYTSIVSIQVKGATGFILDLTLLLGIIAVALGAVAIVISYLALKKSRR